MAQVASNLQGKQFGKLLAITATDKRNHNKTIMWLCKCLNCERETLVPSTKLKSGEIQSCGCMEHVRSFRTEKGHSGLNSLMQKYKHGARSRNLSFELTKEVFKELTSSNCTYCGIKPSNVIYGSLGKAKEHGKYTYNGIDRINNSVGYELSNCVPCCTTCNIAKSNMGLQEFLDWAKRIVQNYTV